MQDIGAEEPRRIDIGVLDEIDQNIAEHGGAELARVAKQRAPVWRCRRLAVVASHGLDDGWAGVGRQLFGLESHFLDLETRKRWRVQRAGRGETRSAQ